MAPVGDDPGDREGYFGERVAAAYDERSAGMFDPAVVGPAVDLLAELAGDGAALEFAIGTGRIALPLAQRGVRVAGIDNSAAMVARLRDKPGAERIDAVVGDMAATRVDGEFSLVYLVFNTIFNLSPRTARWRASRTPPPICAAAGASSSRRACRSFSACPWARPCCPGGPSPAGSRPTSTTSSRSG